VPSRDDVLRHGAGVKGYAAQWKSLVLIHNVIYRLFEHPADRKVQNVRRVMSLAKIFSLMFLLAGLQQHSG